jgi:hypothetical protein
LSWFRFRNRPNAVASATAGVTVEVRPEPGARWIETKGDNLDRIDLADGGIWLRIARPSLQTRVMIAVPDGTIEDFGTTLTVHVSEGRTTAVAVEQGEIAVRLEGRPEMRLKGGQSWVAPPQTPAMTALADDSDKTARRPTSSRAGGATPASIAHPLTTKSAEKRSVAGEHADDPVEIAAGNAEDIAYMRIIDLLRAGKGTEARQAARDYLVRFPDGFRRLEVREVAGSGGASSESARSTP